MMVQGRLDGAIEGLIMDDRLHVDKMCTRVEYVAGPVAVPDAIVHRLFARVGSEAPTIDRHIFLVILTRLYHSNLHFSHIIGPGHFHWLLYCHDARYDARYGRAYQEDVLALLGNAKKRSMLTESERSVFCHAFAAGCRRSPLLTTSIK
jgi:hypothetical protein